MVGRAGGVDELLGPSERFEILDRDAEKGGEGGEGGGILEVAQVGNPPERDAQIGQFGIEPYIGFSLAGAAPHGLDVGYSVGEVAGMCGSNRRDLTAGHKLFFGEL